MSTVGHGGNLTFRPARHMLACFLSKLLPAQEAIFSAEGRMGWLISALFASPSSFYLPVQHPSSKFPSRRGGGCSEEGNVCPIQRRQLLLSGHEVPVVPQPWFSKEEILKLKPKHRKTEPRVMRFQPLSPLIKQCLNQYSKVLSDMSHLMSLFFFFY